MSSRDVRWSRLDPCSAVPRPFRCSRLAFPAVCGRSGATGESKGRGLCGTAVRGWSAAGGPGRPGSWDDGGLVVIFGGDESADLDRVVSEQAPPAPGLHAGLAVHERAGPFPVTFEGRDTAFGSGAPFDQLAEPAAPLNFLAVGAGLASAGDGHLPDTEGFDVGIDFGFPVAPVGGDCVRGSPETFDDPLEGGLEHGGVGRGALYYDVVDHDTVGVVYDLCFVPELHGDTEASFPYRACIGVVQRDNAGGAVGGLAGQTLPGLGDDLLHQIGGAFQVG